MGDDGVDGDNMTDNGDFDCSGSIVKGYDDTGVTLIDD